MIEYPCFRLKYEEKTSYLFGSVHHKKLKTVDPEIAKLLFSSEQAFFEVTDDDNKYDYSINDNVVDNSIDDFLAITFDSVLHKRKLRTKWFFEPSISYFFGNFLEKTKYFSSSEQNFETVGIFEIISHISVYLFSKGIDYTSNLISKYQKVPCFSLDERRKFPQNIPMNIVLGFINFISFLSLYLYKFRGEDSLRIENQNKRITNFNISKYNILYWLLIPQRNNIWIPKIINACKDKNTTIIVGAGHIEDLIDKLSIKEKSIEISKFDYCRQEFI